mgnify:CR=1 FL=1
MRIVKLEQEKKIVIEPATEEVSVMVSELRILDVVDDGEKVTARVLFDGGGLSLLLWNDTTPVKYSDIQWTDEDVNNRILELL